MSQAALTIPTVNPRFKSIIPPLTPDELAMFSRNELGFEGVKLIELKLELLRIIPTRIGPLWWIWTLADTESRSEVYTRHPVAVSRMPIDEWRGFSFKAVPMKPIQKYPPECELKSSGTTNIYFIQSVLGGPVKVGLAANIETRLKTFQTGSPFPLRIVKSITGVKRQTEQELHRKFAKYRLHGEWFSEEVLFFI